MAEVKRKPIKVSTQIDRQVDGIVYINIPNRNVSNRDVMKFYLRERRKLQSRDKMKKGYLEMSCINSNLSEMGFSEDISDFLLYELNLIGCESF